MSHLPIVQMTLYKHGVGYFQRRGLVTGEAIKLTFRREEMDDILKSLTVIDHAEGQVKGIDYDTPQTQTERLAGCSVILGDTRSNRDLLIALRGRQTSLTLAGGITLTGTLLGLDEDEEKPFEQSSVSLLQNESETVAVTNLQQVERVTLHDQNAANDLRFFLQTALGQETHRSITIRLTPGEHDVEVSYIAPAPTWRVSYRLVTIDTETDTPLALLQGWGIFDNRLEEDLEDVSLALTAGMPISFMYNLYQPHTPTRPLVKAENRTAAGPIMFDAAAEADDYMAEEMERDVSFAASRDVPAFKRARNRRSGYVAGGAPEMEKSVQSEATGKVMGELFQYNVNLPVSVGRGQSAMVPIVSNKLNYKKDLIYNGAKMPTHPVATIRFNNSTDLTLESGPVTVLEQGAYVGEAVLPFTANQAEAVISYAVELGIHVKETLKTETHLNSLKIEGRYLVQHNYTIRRLTYRLDNRTPDTKIVLIEHLRNNQYEVFDTPDPTEKTLDTYRYAVPATAGKITPFTVQERFLRSSRTEIKQLSYKTLNHYFNNKFLDRQAYHSLKSLLDLWGEIQKLTQQLKQQENQRNKIYKAQEQAQKNMTVLASTGEEGKLRQRYVKQLTDSEEQLALIDQETVVIQKTINQKEAQIEQIIAALG